MRRVGGHMSSATAVIMGVRAFIVGDVGAIWEQLKYHSAPEVAQALLVVLRRGRLRATGHRS